MDIQFVLCLIAEQLRENDIDFAVVGGVALSYYVKPRLTMDLDLMIMTSDFDSTERILESIGYSCAYKSEDIATFLSKQTKLGRIDFQIAHRRRAVDMLNHANSMEISAGVTLKVLQPEDLIGLKIQAYCNDPDRYFQDMADIKNLLLGGVCRDFERIKEYFEMFDKLADYHQLMSEKRE